MNEPQETRWRVHTLPRTDGTDFRLTLSTPTTDEGVLDAIEAAAANSGMVIVRIADDAD